MEQDRLWKQVRSCGTAPCDTLDLAKLNKSCFFVFKSIHLLELRTIRRLIVDPCFPYFGQYIYAQYEVASFQLYRCIILCIDTRATTITL